MEFAEDSQKQKTEKIFLGKLYAANMPAENFGAALLFLKNSLKTKNKLHEYYYRRAAAVFFVACITSWVCMKLEDTLNGVKNKTDEEKRLLDNLRTNINANVPELKKLWIKLCDLKGIKKGEARGEIKKFLQIYRYRGNFIHYSSKHFNNQYDEDIVPVLTEAPEIIGKIMGVIEPIEKIEWYKACKTDIDEINSM